MSAPGLPSNSNPLLFPALVFRLLGEDGFHHRGEQHPYRSRRDVTGVFEDGLNRSP